MSIRKNVAKAGRIVVEASVNASAPKPTLKIASAPADVIEETKAAIADKVDINWDQCSFEQIPITDIDENEDNPRIKEVAFLDTNPRFAGLVQSFDQNGWLPAYPAIVHRDAGKKRVKLLCGHRRLYAARKNGRIKMVPCIILTGLSKKQQLRLVLDHEQVEGLSDFERLMAFEKLRNQNYGRNAICICMNWFTEKSNGKEIDNYTYDNYERMLRMPPAVQKDWGTYKDGAKKKVKAGFLPTLPNIKKLDSAIKQDIADKWIGAAEDGPSFKAEVAKLRTNAGKDDGPPTGAYKIKDISNLGSKEHRLVLKRLFMRLAGDTDESLDTLIKALRHACDKAFGLPKGADPIRESEYKNVLMTPDQPADDASNGDDAKSQAIVGGKVVKADSAKPSKTVKPDRPGRKVPAPVAAKK